MSLFTWTFSTPPDRVQRINFYIRLIVSPSSCTSLTTERFSKHFLAVCISLSPVSSCCTLLIFSPLVTTKPNFNFANFPCNFGQSFWICLSDNALQPQDSLPQQRCCWRFTTTGCDAMSLHRCTVTEGTDGRTTSVCRVKWSTLLALLYPYARRLISISQHGPTRHNVWIIQNPVSMKSCCVTWLVKREVRTANHSQIYIIAVSCDMFQLSEKTSTAIQNTQRKILKYNPSK